MHCCLCVCYVHILVLTMGEFQEREKNIQNGLTHIRRICCTIWIRSIYMEMLCACLCIFNDAMLSATCMRYMGGSFLSLTKLLSEIWLKVTVNYSNRQLTRASFHTHTHMSHTRSWGTNCVTAEKEKEDGTKAVSSLICSYHICIFDGFCACLPPTFCYRTAHASTHFTIPSNFHICTANYIHCNQFHSIQFS